MIKEFEHPNMKGFVCPICKTSEDRPIILMSVPGTQEKNIARAQQYHRTCAWHFVEEYVCRTTGAIS